MPMIGESRPAPSYERRLHRECELRVASTGRMLRGYAAVFNSLSEPLFERGEMFRERISPGAFSHALAMRQDTKANVEHSSGLSTLGRIAAGTLRLAEDEFGLAVEIDLPDTQVGRDTLELVKRGDLRSMSFAFVVDDEDVSWDGATRTIHKVRKLLDVSIVSEPAYAGTSVEARARQQQSLRARLERQTEEVQRMKNQRITSDPTHGFRSMGAFLQTIARAASSPNPEATRALTTFGSEGVGAEGGNLVPPAFGTRIEELINERGLMQFCDKMRITSNTYATAVDNDAPWSPGGVTAEWVSEAVAKTQNKPLLEIRNHSLEKLVCLLPCGEELLEDAPGLENWITSKLASVVSFKTDLGILQGLGTGQMLGLLNAAGTISVAEQGSQSADTVVSENLRDMVSRLHASDNGNDSVVWICSPSAYQQITEDLSQIPWWAGPRGELRMWGYQVIRSQACEKLGDKGDIFLTDLAQYQIVTRGPRLASSSWWNFDADTTTFRLVLRVSGAPKWNQPISARDGSETISPYVVLDERTG